MTTLLSKKQWSANLRANESLNLPEVLPGTYCKLCEIGIGKDCHEKELWLYQTRHGKAPLFITICGSCADDNKLDFKYRVVDSIQIKELRKFELALYVNKKKKELIIESRNNHNTI